MFIYNTNAPFHLENGATIENLSIAYHTYGELNAQKSNVVWICHALTASSDAMQWWPEMVGENKCFDPFDSFVVCANILGSAYGTSGPLTTQSNRRPLLDAFPEVTIRDMVRAHVLLSLHLGIEKIQILIGASVGGQQALEWSISEPERFEKVILIATNAVHSPYGIAFNESQRMAIRSDVTFGNGLIHGGKKGLAVARSIALLSYRSYAGYLESQKDDELDKVDEFKASSYQRYQGDKLCKRFNAYSYVLLTKAMDSHNVGRNRISVNNALQTIQAKTLVVGITSDVLFPVCEQKLLSESIPNARYEEISSDYGHDGFLLEAEQLTSVFKRFFANETCVEPTKLKKINYN